MAVHNLGPAGCTVPLTLDDCDSTCHLVDLLQDSPTTAVDDEGRTEVTLEGYGYRWLRVLSPREAPII